MNIHEYQGKEILASYGVRIQRGIANSPVKLLLLKQLTTETGTSWYVVNSCRWTWKRWWSKTYKIQQVEEISEQIIGMQLITPQTSAEGKKVSTKF
jgi:succinyl-CoA synthetase beta subunit